MAHRFTAMMLGVTHWAMTRVAGGLRSEQISEFIDYYRLVHTEGDCLEFYETVKGQFESSTHTL